METVIKVENVWKIFGKQADEAFQALERKEIAEIDIVAEYNCFLGIADCSFDVQRGEIFCIMGLSGSGKSTVIRHLNRLVEPTAGRISILGQNILKSDEKSLRQMRAKKIAMVFQHMALLPHLTVRENVTFPLRLQRESKAHCWETSEKCLELVNLKGQGERFPAALSGGMRQRVGLARALACDPEILLMDEPFSALDPLIRRQLQDEFIDLSKRLGKTTVFITHDLDEAMRIGHRIAIMLNGRIVQIGTPQEIVSRPANSYVQEFVEGI